MEKEVIDLTTSSSSSPRSLTSKKAQQSETCASSKKTQIRKEKCDECSEPPKPNLNNNTTDLSSQTNGFPGAFQTQVIAAATPAVSRPNTSLLQLAHNTLDPWIPKEPRQLEHFACNMPPQYEGHAPNFNSQLSTPCLYNSSASVNYLMKKNVSPPKTLKLFPVANNVDKSTSAFKGLKKKERANAGSRTMASNAEVDLELRLWFPMNN